MSRSTAPADGGHGAGAQALTAVGRVHPDALDLGGLRRHGRHLGLEDDLVALDVGECLPVADELSHPRAVEPRPAAGLRRDAQLVGEHRDAGGVEDVELVGPDPLHPRVRGHQWGGAKGEERLVGTDLAGRPPVRAEQVPEPAHLVVGSEDRRRVPALRQGVRREGPQRLRGGVHRDEVGGDVAERDYAGPVVVPPQLAAEPARVKSGRADPVVDEHVGDRVLVEDPANRWQVVAPEHADLAPSPQHQMHLRGRAYAGP